MKGRKKIVTDFYLKTLKFKLECLLTVACGCGRRATIISVRPIIRQWCDSYNQQIVLVI